MDRLIRMIVNMLLRRGINGAIGRVAGPAKHRRDMTPAERAQADAARTAAARARQAARLSRRL